jgi:hypothetical protein
MDHLLTDLQIQEFLVKGYLIIHPEEYSIADNNIHDNIRKAILKMPNPGNNLSPKVADLEHIITNKKVESVLVSLLGNNYGIQAHRYPHIARQQQKWHHDTVHGNLKQRSDEIQMLMLMYYPQTVIKKSGPSEIIEGSQYTNFKGKPYALNEQVLDDKQEIFGKKLSLLVKKGSIVIINYNIIHRGTAPIENDSRIMCKYQFYRRTEPVKPSWNHKSFEWLMPKHTNDVLHGYLWSWMSGKCNQGINKNSITYGDWFRRVKMELFLSSTPDYNILYDMLLNRFNQSQTFEVIIALVYTLPEKVLNRICEIISDKFVLKKNVHSTVKKQSNKFVNNSVFQIPKYPDVYRNIELVDLICRLNMFTKEPVCLDIVYDILHMYTEPDSLELEQFVAQFALMVSLRFQKK